MRNIEKIAKLNDILRQTFLTGRVVMTRGIQELPEATRERVFSLVRCYSDFDAGNNPHGERDFGAFELGGESYFWKIDYYDNDLTYLNPNPENPNVTIRVLTIMLADEY
ncbi:MAG: DUF3768 domain-containing protein [Cohaesibacter sp.]|nr:DUF3768 domain-containing protein [Cohaesibacter sp.]